MMSFTPTEDVYEQYKDGSGRVRVAEAGKPIQWAFAYELGLVATPDAPQGIVDTVPDVVEEAPKRGKRND